MRKGLLLAMLLATGLAVAQKDKTRELGLQAAKLRGLSYRPVPAQVVSQEECAKYLLTLLDKELEPVQTKKRESFLKLIGLMPENASVKKILAELYTDQVRGLYDPHKKRYLVVKGGGSDLTAQMAGMAGIAGFDIQDILTVHELGHAIQDQHFNLAALSKRVAVNFDHEIAAQSLIEGDASVLMLDYAMAAMGMDSAGIDPSMMGGMDTESMMLGQSAALARAPRFFRESLSFPYGQGLQFVSTLKQRGGWKAVDRAFSALPQSSEQILHPEKYPRDRPMELNLDVPWLKLKSLGQDTAGEFTVRVWAHELGLGDEAAAGWGGDTYEVFDGPTGPCAVWATVWDNERDAKEFAGLAKKGLNKKWAGNKSKTTQVEQTGRQVVMRIGIPKGMAPK